MRSIQQARGLTILYTSHNMREVEEICDRIVFIHRGEKIVDGTVRAIVSQLGGDSLERWFIRIARGGEVVSRDA